jgi:hypothetical protein
MHNVTCALVHVSMGTVSSHVDSVEGCLRVCRHMSRQQTHIVVLIIKRHHIGHTGQQQVQHIAGHGLVVDGLSVMQPGVLQCVDDHVAVEQVHRLRALTYGHVGLQQSTICGFSDGYEIG